MEAGGAAETRAAAVEKQTAPEPEPQSVPAVDAAEEGAASQAGAEAAEGGRAFEPSAADASDERVRKAEGIAFDPTVDEAPARGETLRS
jgi:hypothetical protein